MSNSLYETYGALGLRSDHDVKILGARAKTLRAAFVQSDQ